MRILLLPILASLFFVGCAQNIDQGKIGIKKTTTVSNTTTGNTNISSGIEVAGCKGLSVSGGTDPAFATTFNGSIACAGTNPLNAVRLKVNAYFPQDTRFCIVPLTFNAAFAATCFTINGQADIQTATGSFQSIALVRETDLAAYVRYLQGQSASYPPMGFATLR